MKDTIDFLILLVCIATLWSFMIMWTSNIRQENKRVRYLHTLLALYLLILAFLVLLGVVYHLDFSMVMGTLIGLTALTPILMVAIVVMITHRY